MHIIRSTESPFIPASHEDPRNPGVLKRVIATRDILQRGQVQMLNWAQLPAGLSFQPHYHEDMQEVFVMLSGHVRMTVDGAEALLEPGDTIIVEPREIHIMTNLGSTTAEYVVFGISSESGGRTVVVAT